MTPEQFLALDPTQLEAGPEADRAMATALGWYLGRKDGMHKECWFDERDIDQGTVLPKWSVDPHAAVDVYLATPLQSYPFTKSGGWWVEHPFFDGLEVQGQKAETFPLAVVRCKVAMEQAKLRASAVSTGRNRAH